MKTSYEHNKEIIRKIQPTMSYNGKDYGSWKATAREQLKTLLGFDNFIPSALLTEIQYTKNLPGFNEIRFTFQSEQGYRVPCVMRIPSGAGKPPVIICLQGHTSGMHISLGEARNSRDEASISGGDRDFCVRAVREGFAAVALEQRNFGEVGEGGCFESAMTALLSGRTAIGERVWDISRLIDVLEDEFSDIINVQRIGIMGNSGGGTTTVYAAALEDRIKLAMPSCAMCTYRDSIGAMHHCACNYIPRIAEYFDMGDLMAMACPKYFIQVSGREDDIFPLGGAAEAFGAGKKAYEDNSAGDRCVMITGNGGHRFYADDAWPWVHKFFNKF